MNDAVKDVIMEKVKEDSHEAVGKRMVTGAAYNFSFAANLKNIKSSIIK